MYDGEGGYNGDDEQYIPAKSRLNLTKLCTIVTKHTASQEFRQYLVY
jgi:hypothetical protein